MVFSFTLEAKPTNKRSKELDSLKILSTNTSIDPDVRIWSIMNYCGLTFTDPKTNARWNIFINYLIKAKSKKPSLDTEYMIRLLKCFKYSHENKIGLALYEAGKYREKIKKTTSKKELIRLYTLYKWAYNRPQTQDENAKYLDLIFNLRTQGKKIDSVYHFYTDYSWHLFNYGRYKKDTSIIRKSAYYRKQIIQYKHDHAKPGNRTYDYEDYKTYSMALMAIHEYKELITVSKKTLDFIYTDIKNKQADPNEQYFIDLEKKMITNMAQAYAKLGNTDSSNYYINHPKLVDKDPSPLKMYYAQAHAYLHLNEWYEKISNYLILKNNKQAADLAYEGLFSANKFPEPEVLIALSESMAPVFYDGGRYKEAAQCYKIAANINDSLKKVDQKLMLEKEKALSQIELYSAKMLQAKKDALVKQENKKQALLRNALFIGLFLMFVIVTAIYLGLRRKKKDNAIIKKQKLEVEEKQKEIIDSIHYAKRIQTSLMRSEKNIAAAIKELKTKSHR